MKGVFLTIAFTLALIPATFSQGTERITDDQFNSWYMYFGTYGVSEKLSIHSEIQFRRSGWIEDPQQLLTRIGLNYRAGRSVMLTAGYGFIITQPYGKQPVAEKFNEHRLWEQLILNHSEGRFFFNHRFRQEQRWLENPSSEESTFNYLNRSRYRFMVSIPLNNSSLEKGTWFLSLYDEIFIGYGKNVGANIFDQNRLYGAIGYQVGNASNLQLGYLNQRIQKGNGIFFENNHTFQLAFTHTIDLK